MPETIARFLREAAEFVPLTLKAIPALPHTFEPARTPRSSGATRRTRTGGSRAADRYPRCSTDRETAETNKLEWVTPGHPLFEAIRRHTHAQALESSARGVLPLARARTAGAHRLLPGPRRRWARPGRPRAALRRRDRRGRRTSAPGARPARQLHARGPAGPAARRRGPPEASPWLHEHGLAPFLEETRKDRWPRSIASRRTSSSRSPSCSSAQTRRSGGRRPRSSRRSPAPRAACAGGNAARRAVEPPRAPPGPTSIGSGRSPSRQSNGSRASWSCRTPSARRPRCGGSSRIPRPRPPRCAW